MRIPLVVFLAPLTLQLACSTEGPIQNVGPRLTITPATVSVETGADPIPLTAGAENGNLTGTVTWSILSGSAGTLDATTGTRVNFVPSGLGTSGGAVVVQATATVTSGSSSSSKAGSAAVTVVPSTHGRIRMGIDPGGIDPQKGAAWVDVTDGLSKTTFVTSVTTTIRSPILDAGTYRVTADAGIAIAGSVVDSVYDGTVQFDGGTPARSLDVPVRPNQETGIAVRFALRGGQGRLWLPASDNVRGYTETELVIEHDGQTGFLAAGGRAVAFDADGNLWATFSDGTVRQYAPESLASPSATPAKTVAVNDPTGIAISGNTVLVASCGDGKVYQFQRTDPAPAPTGFITGGVTCPWGISYDSGGTGKVWVTQHSGANGHVFRYPATGGAIPEAGIGTAVNDAYGVAIDVAGNVWVSSCAQSSIQRVHPTPADTAIGPPLFTDFACSGGLAFDKAGTLWVVSQGNTGNPNGNLISMTQLQDGGVASTGSIQLSNLSQVSFGGLAFDPAAAGLPVHQ